MPTILIVHPEKNECQKYIQLITEKYLTQPLSIDNINQLSEIIHTKSIDCILMPIIEKNLVPVPEKLKLILTEKNIALLYIVPQDFELSEQLLINCQMERYDFIFTPIIPHILFNRINNLLYFKNEVNEYKELYNNLRTGYKQLHYSIENISAEQTQKIFLLSTVVEQTGDAIQITDSRGRIIYINKAFEELTGYTLQDAMGNRTLLKSDLTSPEVYKELWSTVSQKKNWIGTLINKKKSGHTYKANILVSPIVDDHGNIVNFVSVQRDLSEIEALQNELSLYYKNLEKVIDNRVSLIKANSSIQKRLLSTLDLDSIIQKSIQDAVQLIQADGGAIGLIDNKSMAHVTWSCNLTDFEHFITELDEFYPHQESNIKKPCLIKNYKQAYQSELKNSLAVTLNIQAMIFIPLYVDDKLEGIFSVFKTEENSLTNEDLHTLETLGDSIALAIKNANLIQEIQSNVRFTETLMNNAPACILILDEQCRISNNNQLSKYVIETDLGELKDKNFIDLFSPYAISELPLKEIFNQLLRCDMPDAHTENLSLQAAESCSLSKQAFTFQTVFSSDNEPIYLNWSVRRQFFEKREKLLFICIAQDITDRVKLQQELEEMAIDLLHKNRVLEKKETELLEKNRVLEIQYKEVERTTQAKTRFLASMSHELRTPLNAIIGFSEILNSTAQEKVTFEDVNNFSGYIHKSGQHLLSLINDILDISRVESGRIELSLSQIDLSTFVLETLTTIQNQAQKKEIVIHKKFDPEIHLIITDKMKLKQILLNLLSNAIKYTKEKGEVTISYSMQVGYFILFSVQDTGIGIEKKYRDHVFQDFGRIEQDEYAVSQEGTGLGLTLTKKLVTFLGGDIWFESTYGVGTTFCFMLPSQKETSLPDKKQISQNPQEDLIKPENILLSTPKTILIIDDNKLSVKYAESLLKQVDNLHVITSLTAPEGIELAKLEKPDLILLDIQMPGMDGFTAVKLLQEEPETVTIPVIAVTALVANHTEEEFLQIGFSDYIAKPYSANILIIKVIQYLERF